MSNEKGRRVKGKKKKANKKKIIIILLILLILGGLLTYLFKNNFKTLISNSDNETKKEISKHILEEKQYEEIKFTNITLKTDESASYFKCNVENMTDNKLKNQDIFIVFEKEDKSELARFKYKIKDIEPQGQEKISIATTTSLVDAYDFHIEK